MKVKGKVNVYLPDLGIRRVGTIVSIDGAGDSRAKLLTIQYRYENEDQLIGSVPHLRDAPKGEAFWLPKGESAPDGWAEK